MEFACINIVEGANKLIMFDSLLKAYALFSPRKSLADMINATTASKRPTTHIVMVTGFL